MKRTLNTTISRSKNEKGDERYMQQSGNEDEMQHDRFWRNGIDKEFYE